MCRTFCISVGARIHADTNGLRHGAFLILGCKISETWGRFFSADTCGYYISCFPSSRQLIGARDNRQVSYTSSICSRILVVSAGVGTLHNPVILMGGGQQACTRQTTGPVMRCYARETPPQAPVSDKSYLELETLSRCRRSLVDVVDQQYPIILELICHH